MKTTAFLALGAALLAAPALAQPANPPANPGAGPGRMAAMFDTNNDGRITFEEGWAVATQRFQAADVDRNGSLSFAEFQSLRWGPGAQGGTAQPQAQGQTRPEFIGRGAERRAAMFRALDANTDGGVTLAEMQGAAQAMFRAMDANGDGAIERSEMPRRGHRHGHGGHGHGGYGHGPHHGQGYGPRGEAPATPAPTPAPAR